MREHHALWFAGRARGVNDGCEFMGPGFVGKSTHQARLFLLQLLAPLLELKESKSFGLLDTFFIEENHMLNSRAFTQSLFHPEKLIVVSDQQKACPRVF